ncbi:MAG: hypothetical protein ACYDAR_01120, partial [Thermomicrobiales bacterium]
RRIDTMVTITARFATSTLTATPTALETLAAAGIAPSVLLARHFTGEWGGDADNARVNERYLRDGEGMLLSVFADVPGGPVWVISHIGDGVESYTTILMPSEY